MEFSCDFCGSKKGTLAYTVPGSALQSQIYVCTNCSLVQSKQTALKKKSKAVRISSDADWGNIRIGKSLRFKSLEPILTDLLSSSSPRMIVDVGSNRGDVVLWLHERLPKAKILAIEPDTLFTRPYKNIPEIEVKENRLEEITLNKNTYDLVVCFHTLEHLPSARAALWTIVESLKMDGSMVFEVPNLSIIGEEDIVEEFFIDKHSFHFTREILVSYFEQLGLEITYGKDLTDVSNCTLVLRKKKEIIPALFQPTKNGNSSTIITLIHQYEKRLVQNRKKLKEVAKNLNAFMDRQKVMLWGGGRIYDALVKYGKLDTSKAQGLIDTYFTGKIDSLHGLPVSRPEILRQKTVDVVVLLGKSSVSEIEKQVRKFGVRHCIAFADLLAQVA